MNQRLTSIIFILLLVSNCGFTPVYKATKNTNFQIKNISFEGDTTINNYLNLRLSRYKNLDKEKKYSISTKTDYQKNVFSKDQAGNALDFELIAKTTFSISKNGILIKNLTYTEKFIMENANDQFEERDFERIIKQNFANTITNKLISELLLFE